MAKKPNDDEPNLFSNPPERNRKKKRGEGKKVRKKPESKKPVVPSKKEWVVSDADKRKLAAQIDARMRADAVKQKNAQALIDLQREQAAAPLPPVGDTPEDLKALEREIYKRRRERKKTKPKSQEAIRAIKRENQRRLKAGQKKLTGKERRQIRTNVVLKKRGAKALNRYLGKGSWFNPLTVKGGLTALGIPLALGFATDVSRGLREQFGAGSSWFDGKDAVDEMLEPQMAQAKYASQLRRRAQDLERMRSLNRDKIERYAPQLAASLKAGMELPEDAVVIGGRPRMDLLNDVADRMSKGEFNQEM